MNSEELKLACGMAGGELSYGPSYVFDRGTPIGVRLLADSPALYAYVAELLVAQVRERDSNALRREFRLKMPYDQSVATAEQRIRAAMAVLQPETAA